MKTISELLSAFNEATGELIEYRNKHFQSGTIVRVDTEKYNGIGVVESDNLCPIQCVPVKLPNGNVWYYSIEDVEAI